MNELEKQEESLSEHITEHAGHRFQPVLYRGNQWDLSHLDPFAFKINIGNERCLVVVVLFSCHCFTHKQNNDTRDVIPPDEIYPTAQETRVLNQDRYNLSKSLLIQIIHQLHQRHISVAEEGRNFVTIEKQDTNGVTTYYGVFFEISKDKHRRGRMILRVQSAYLLQQLTKRQQSAKRVRFIVLLKAIYEGRSIRA